MNSLPEGESVASQATTRMACRRCRKADVAAFLWFQRGGLALAVAAVLLSGAPAVAADPLAPDAERKSRASAHLVKGAQLIDAEDLQGALAQFEAAYRLVPSPVILHNFGVVYQGLGRKAEALDAFERFLAGRPGPARRARPRRTRVAECRPGGGAAGPADLEGRASSSTAATSPRHPTRHPALPRPGAAPSVGRARRFGALFAERVEVARASG